MNRERALKFVLVLVGLLFSALVYPLLMFVRQEPALAMMLSLYVTLGIFLLLAARNPSANHSLFAFTAWSSFAHASLMAVAGVPDSDRTRRIGGRGCARYHWCCPDCSGCGKAGRISSRRVGSLDEAVAGTEAPDQLRA